MQQTVALQHGAWVIEARSNVGAIDARRHFSRRRDTSKYHCLLIRIYEDDCCVKPQ